MATEAASWPLIEAPEKPESETIGTKTTGASTLKVTFTGLTQNSQVDPAV